MQNILVILALLSISNALEIGNMTSIAENLDYAAQSIWGSIEAVTTRKSRKKVKDFEPRPKLETMKTPTVIFHGVRQKCVEP